MLRLVKGQGRQGHKDQNCIIGYNLGPISPRKMKQTALET